MYCRTLFLLLSLRNSLLCVVIVSTSSNPDPSSPSPSPSSPPLMEDQRERVADASFAFVRRHHLRRLALSLVELAPQHHLSPLHLPPSREGKEDRRWVDIIKMDTRQVGGRWGTTESCPTCLRRGVTLHRKRRRHPRRRRHRVRIKMEQAANESISNVDNSEEGETTSSSSAELDRQQPASMQTHSVVCWNIQCPDCPSPIARITPWPRPPPLAPRQLTPEDRRAAFALASLRAPDPVRSEEITRATGSRGSLVSQVAEAQRQGHPIGE
jgi:hypothetical protein